MLKLNKKVLSQNYKDKTKCTLFPKDKKELIFMMEEAIIKYGNNCSLNHIDVSNFTNLTRLFESTFVLQGFDGDISEWDVSNLEDAWGMFRHSKYTGEYGDISNWDVSKLKNANFMFNDSFYKGDISSWNLKKLEFCNYMFFNCGINIDLSKWDLTHCKDARNMFLPSYKKEWLPKT